MKNELNKHEKLLIHLANMTNGESADILCLLDSFILNYDQEFPVVGTDDQIGI